MMKRILSLTIVAVILVCGTLMSGATSIGELEAQQEELERKSAEYSALLEQKNAEVAEQQEYVDALVGKVETVNEQIQVSRDKIAALDEEITEKQGEIDQKNADIETNMNILRNRIKTIYISGDVSSLEIILGAKDFSDFLDKVQLVKSVSNHDEELINEIKEQLEQISAEKEELESDKADLEEEEANLEAKQEELNTLLEDNKETLATLQAASDEALQLLTLTDEELAGLSEDIQEYYRQQREAAAAAALEGGSSNVVYTPSNLDAPIVAPSGGYVWPCPGFYYLSSRFEEWRGTYNHGAIDIAGAGIMGAVVVAADAGTVVVASQTCPHNWGKSYSCGCGGGYGNYVQINHGNGKETIYGHLSSVAVSYGQTVSAGQVIGYVGSTGHSTGAHLHFECRYNGYKYNPMNEF